MTGGTSAGDNPLAALVGRKTMRQYCAGHARRCWLLSKSISDPAASHMTRRIAKVWIAVGRRHARDTPGRWIADALIALERQEGKDRR